MLSAVAFAQDSEDTKPFEAEVSLGALTTSGNTDSTSLQGKMDLKHEMTNWRTNYILDALYKEGEVSIEDANGDTREEIQATAEKYFASAQADYKLNEEHRGLFVFLSYETDRFGGYEYQGTFAAGYSDRLFKTDSTRLNYSIGPGVAFSKTDVDDGEVDADGNPLESVEEQNAVIRLSVDFRWDINDNAFFTQTLASDIATESETNTKTRSETAVTATLTDSFALKAAYSIQHNSEVRGEVDNTDTQTSISLVYSF